MHVCACADDTEVCRHWALGSLPTDTQTVGLPTGGGVLQTGAANHADVGCKAITTTLNMQTALIIHSALCQVLELQSPAIASFGKACM